MKNSQRGTVRRADTLDDFNRLGLDPVSVQPDDDGPRIKNPADGFEWWYFDALLQDGTMLVVMFFTKPFNHARMPPKPIVTISLKRAGDAAPIERRAVYSAEDYAAGGPGCTLRIGPNSIRGDLHRYDVKATVDDVAVHIGLDSSAPPLRIGAGSLLFERGPQSHQFGWLAAVPRGQVQVSYQVGAEQCQGTGTGYHDHNWGDADLLTLTHHWYWGRAQVGARTVIATCVFAQPDYGGDDHADLVILGADGQVEVEGSAAVRFEQSATEPDPFTGKPVPQWIRCTLYDSRTRARYQVSFNRLQTVKHAFLDPQTQALPGSDPEDSGAYHRFAGSCELAIADSNGLKALPPVPTLWEMMWFGRAPEGRPPG